MNEEIKITYKTRTNYTETYPTCNIKDYLSLIRKNWIKLYKGDFEIFISNKVSFGGQELFFPFITIDGEEDYQEELKLQSAIAKINQTVNIFDRLNSMQHFFTLANGDTGFVLVSPLLFNKKDYKAFTDFIRLDFQNIAAAINITDTTTPHGFFTFSKDKILDNRKQIIRHSAEIPVETFDIDAMTPRFYKQITTGKTDPDRIIDFMERFLSSLHPVIDISSLNELGRKIKEYNDLSTDVSLTPTSIIPKLQKRQPLSLEEMQQKLHEHGYKCKIKTHGNLAISFQRFKCPVCSKTEGNPYAYPPHYTLYCRRRKCAAHEGIPLYKWAPEIAKDLNFYIPYKSKTDLFLTAATETETIESARLRITQELDEPHDSLLLITPGAGKTYCALDYIKDFKNDKIIIYSCYNKDLKNEAYNKILELTDNNENIFKIKSREELCSKKGELEIITNKGFSPAEILCSHCEFREECEYYQQYKNISPGIYFTTHHTLQYLTQLFHAPDMIILDENLIAGFLLNESCTMDDISMLGFSLDEREFNFLHRFLSKIQTILYSIRQSQDKSYESIINGKPFKNIDTVETPLLTLIAKLMDTSEEEILNRISTVVNHYSQFSQKDLFNNGVNLKALNWLKGFITNDVYPYISIHKAGFIFSYKYVTPLKFKESKIKILDGTGNKEIAETITGRKINVLKLDVNWSSSSLVHIKKDTSRQTMLYDKIEKLEQTLKDALDKVSAKNILIVSYKFLLPKISKICKDIDSSRKFDFFYFHGPRGINKYQNCDGVIIIGLPYSNLNACWHDANILFQNSDDKEIVNLWADANMLWETYQCIFRTRPLQKNVEIVIVSKLWPSILPELTETIIQSQSEDTYELAKERLEPFVREFGFLNPDLGFLANVYIKSKEDLAVEFRKKLNEIISLYTSLPQLEKANSTSGISLNKESLQIGHGGDFQQFYVQKRLISALYIYMLKLAFSNSGVNLHNLYSSVIKTKSALHSEPIILSNTKRFADLLIYFQKKYPHYEKFKIRLPHCMNQSVKGIGMRKDVISFYEEISRLGIFIKVDVMSYQPEDSEPVELAVIPDGVVVIDIPDESLEVINIGFKNEIITVEKPSETGQFARFMSGVIQSSDLRIITSRGKILAKLFLKSGLPEVRISDVILNEKIIRNGEAGINKMSLKLLFKKYGFLEDTDKYLAISQMYKVWEIQQGLIEEYGIKEVVELEENVLWIVADMEVNGISIDVDGILEFLDSPEYKGTYDYEEVQRLCNFIGADDKIHDVIEQLGTVTGRINSKLHNLKKEGFARSFIKSREGYTFVIADYKQQEPRIAAGLSGDTEMLRIFEGKKDIYEEMGKILFKGSEKDTSEIRKIMKQLFNMFLNGAGVKGIYNSLKGEFGDSVSYTDILRLFGNFDIFKGWRAQEAERARRNGYIKSAYGRRRFVYSRTETPSLYNYPLQCTGSDGLKLVLIELDRKFVNERIDARVVHTQHDAVIVETKEDLSDEIEQIVNNTMIKVFQEMIPNVPFGVKIKTQRAWYEPQDDRIDYKENCCDCDYCYQSNMEDHRFNRILNTFYFCEIEGEYIENPEDRIVCENFKKREEV